MKDAKGHGSAAHQSAVEAARDSGMIFARPTGFPVGGYYATHPDTGETVRKPDAKYGDLPPRFNSPEKAHQFALKMFKRESK